jgi:hypothetical protein
MSRSKNAGTRETTTVDTRLRWLAAIIALVTATVLMVQINGSAKLGYDTGNPTLLHRLRDAVKSDGFILLGGYFTVLLTGAVLHTPIALRRRARIGAGWLTVAALVAYGIAVAGLAALLAPNAPDHEYSGSTRSGDPGSLYPAMLGCMLGGPALLVLCGAVFPPSAGGHEEDGRSAVFTVVVTLGISGLLGVVALVWLGVRIAVSA